MDIDALRGEMLKELGAVAQLVKDQRDEARDARAKDAKEARLYHEKQDSRMAALETGVSTLRSQQEATTRAVTSIERRQSEVEKRHDVEIKNVQQKSAHDLSEFKSVAETTNGAVQLAFENLEKRVEEIAKDNQKQTTSLANVQSETAAQTPLLEKLTSSSKVRTGLAAAGAFAGAAAADFVLELLKGLGH